MKIPTIRELMPPGFLPLLCKRTSSANLSNMSQVVSLENHRSTFWPAVLKLAEETNPTSFAIWAAANPDKVPAAVAQAA
ncbi:MAG: hypothetical protein ACRYFZ_28195 [Janthinobacterium lividum]